MCGGACAGGGQMERGEEGQLQLEETMEADTTKEKRTGGEARRGASVVVPSRACVRGARRGEIRIWAVVSRRGRHRAPRSREAREARKLLLATNTPQLLSISGHHRAAVYTNGGRAASGRSPGTRQLQAESGRAGPGSLRRSAQTPDVPRTRPGPSFRGIIFRMRFSPLGKRPVTCGGPARRVRGREHGSDHERRARRIVRRARRGAAGLRPCKSLPQTAKGCTSGSGHNIDLWIAYCNTPTSSFDRARLGGFILNLLMIS